MYVTGEHYTDFLSVPNIIDLMMYTNCFALMKYKNKSTLACQISNVTQAKYLKLRPLFASSFPYLSGCAENGKCQWNLPEVGPGVGALTFEGSPKVPKEEV